MPGNDQQPATRADIRALRTELTAAIEAAELRLAARLERAEHALLRGFRTFARDQDLRTTTLEARVNMLQRRLIEIELKLGLQPPEQQ